jgi:4-amino-4-deoxy-L-arabinose transferase-like glycosyltransferase
MFDVIAWMGIGLGTLLGAFTVIEMTTAKSVASAANPGERRRAWLSLGSCVLVIAVGVSYLAAAAKNDPLAWTARSATIAVVGVTIALWLRARIRGKPAGPDH